MEEFLNKLYSYEYFGTYLMIAIAVLVLLFIIVLFFGKKDQKKREIEETKKLQQINNTDAFKEQSNVASVEVPKEVAPTPTIAPANLESDTIIVPNINDLVSNSDNAVNADVTPEPVLPKEELSTDTLNVETANENNINNQQQPIEIVSEPILNKVEEKPLVFNDNTNEEQPLFDIPENVNVEPPIPLVDVPDFNLDEITNGVEEIKEETQEDIAKPAEVFSSVYVPQKEEVELPKLEEEKPKKDDLDIELPTLKKEVEDEKIEMPVLNDYNLDNITGEDYNINK